MNVDVVLTQILLINLNAFRNFLYKLCPFSVRLTGRPVGQSANKTTKKMVCSIYTEPQKKDELVRIKVFFVNAILDSVMVSCLALSKLMPINVKFVSIIIFTFLFNSNSLLSYRH